MPDKILGMYVHQHWPYNHPYAARTWSLEDWRGYASGLHQLGFNTVLIWPMLGMIPDPLPDSDRRYLQRLGDVVAMLHRDLDMRVFLAVNPNMRTVDEVAVRSPLEERHFFYSDVRVDPGDPAAIAELFRRYEERIQPLREVDGITVIDSDPAGYPGSTNQEFVDLFRGFRTMLDRLRPGIELVYWVHAGWEAYSRFYETGKFEFGLEEEFVDTMRRLAEINPEPWGIANGIEFAEQLGLRDRVYGFNYGAIEGEPVFPMTNFTPDLTREIAARPAPRGVMGNAQTHCIQLPNTLAFAHGALGRELTDQDFVDLAGGLLGKHGDAVFRAWKGFDTESADECLSLAGEMEELQDANLKVGELSGLLFGSPRRFVNDLVLQLRMRGTCLRLCESLNGGNDHHSALREFVLAADQWQAKHGYRNRWQWPELNEALAKIGSPEIDRALDDRVGIGEGFTFVKSRYFREETHTLIILQALKRAVIGARFLDRENGDP